jgi:hypothetical protein
MLVAAGRWFSKPPTSDVTLKAVGRSLSVAQLRKIALDRKRHCLASRATPRSHFGLSCRKWRRQAGLPLT